MRLHRPLILSAGLLLAFSTVAAADGDWETVNLGHNSGVTIDIPAAVGDEYTPAEKNNAGGDLMFFDVVTSHSGEMYCALSRHPYPSDMNAQQASERLSSPTRDVLCGATDNMSNTKIGESESITISGFPAGRCAASYTNTSPDETDKGWVESVMMVAAPDGLYHLICEVHTDSQDEATAEWALYWADKVHHIQESLRLPAAKQ